MLLRSTACALLLWFLPACTTWQVEKGVNPQTLISTKHPTKVRLTRADRSHVVLHQPQIDVGDSVSGVRIGVVSDATVSVPVSDVAVVEIRKFSASRTIMLVVGIASLLATADLSRPD